MEIQSVKYMVHYLELQWIIELYHYINYYKLYNYNCGNSTKWPGILKACRPNLCRSCPNANSSFRQLDVRRLPYWPLCICMLSLQTSTRLTKLTDVDSISFYVSFEDCAKLIMLIFYWMYFHSQPNVTTTLQYLDVLKDHGLRICWLIILFPFRCHHFWLSH